MQLFTLPNSNMQLVVLKVKNRIQSKVFTPLLKSVSTRKVSKSCKVAASKATSKATSEATSEAAVS